MDVQAAGPPSGAAAPGVAVGTEPADRPVHRKGAARPAPARNGAYAHLSIPALRELRRSLTAEEGRVSYWRRILQARLDVVEAATGAREIDAAALRPLLSTERVGAGRRALVQVLPVDDIPPLPRLAELWDRQVTPSDGPGTAAFAAELRAAEGQLSAYRSALHRGLGEATGELIARYREQPTLCLSALPVDPRRPGLPG